MVEILSIGVPRHLAGFNFKTLIGRLKGSYRAWEITDL